MNKIPDRAKRRREYLWKKGIKYLLTGLMLAGAILCTGVLLMVIFLIFGSSFRTPAEVAIVSGLIGVFAPLTYLFICGYYYHARQARSILYILPAGEQRNAIPPEVPPLPPQVAALHSEEVLLRGSEAPAASPVELLRPAGRHETPAEELLRATTGNEE